MAEDSLDPACSDLIPARMLNALVYCPRLYYLEHVAGEWDENADTLSGKRVHRRVDRAASPLPAAEGLPDAPIAARSVTVASPAEGVIAKTDVIEAEQGRVVPVDYKRGEAPDAARVPGGVWPADRMQMAVQMLCLRDAGYACEEGALYYAASKRRVPLPWSEELRAQVREAVAEARRLAASPVAPPPLVASPKCPRCSLSGICLPDETHALMSGEAAVPEADEDEDGDGTDAAAPPPLRRLIPASDERASLYVQVQGARIGRSGECLEVREPDGSTSTVQLRSTSHVSVFGSVQLTAAALQELCGRDIGVSLFSCGGWYYGSVSGFSGKNVLLRMAQFQAAADPARRLGIARALIAGKILNCRTLLRRNAKDLPGDALRRLKQLAGQALAAPSEESLLGIEGTAARIYFEGLGGLFSPRAEEGGEEPAPGAMAFDFNGRNRRPPRDPVNALLSLAYALLLKDVRIALCASGFDPMVGFFHRPRHGRPALALDLMEEFRPLIADSVVLTAVNTRVVTPSDFVRAAGAVALSDAGRRAFIAAYERRMEQMITHPLFGYTISYRRVLEVQARLLARVVTGEIDAYPSMRTR